MLDFNFITVGRFMVFVVLSIYFYFIYYNNGQNFLEILDNILFSMGTSALVVLSYWLIKKFYNLLKSFVIALFNDLK